MSMLSLKKDSRCFYFFREFLLSSGMILTIPILMIFLICPLRAEDGSEKNPASVNSFKGRIIYLKDSELELKNGDVEIRAYMTEETQITDAEGKKSGIRLCQWVEVKYTGKDRKVIQSIRIISPGYCEKTE